MRLDGDDYSSTPSYDVSCPAHADHRSCLMYFTTISNLHEEWELGWHTDFVVLKELET